MLCSIDKAACTHLLVAIVKELGLVTQPGHEMTQREQKLKSIQLKLYKCFSNMLAMSFSASCDDFSSGLGPRQSGSPSDASKFDELALHPVTLALSGFFELFYKVVTQQEQPVTPCTSFAFRVIEYVRTFLNDN
jgi:hypothetical protein